MAKLPEDHPISAHKDIVGQTMHRWKHHDPKPLHSGRGKGGKEGKIVKSQDQAIAIALSLAGKSKDHAERLQGLGFSEDCSAVVGEMLDSLDFTRCQRPNGTYYGTSGSCRKGSQVAAKVHTHSLSVTFDPGYSRKDFGNFVKQYDGKIIETDKGVSVTFPSERDAKAFAQMVPRRRDLKGVHASEKGIHEISGTKGTGKKAKAEGRTSASSQLADISSRMKDIQKKEVAARLAGDTEAERKHVKEWMKESKAFEDRRDLLNQRLKELESRKDDAITIKEQERYSQAISTVLDELRAV